MISSKKIDLISILLIALVLVFTVYAILFPQAVLNGQAVGVTEYSQLHKVTVTEDDYYTSHSDTAIAKIDLNGTFAETNSSNVKTDGGDVTILGGGVYVLSGTLEDGSITVDAPDGAQVRLILNGVNIKSTDFAAIYIKQAAKTVISLVPGTENSLTDGEVYDEASLEDGKPSAALYSKDDLTINGTGSLIINGNYRDGIKANDVLKIIEGTLIITAADDGINANDYIAALSADITITSGGDGIKCDHESREKGFIAFESASLSVTCGSDGISASSSLYINGGSLNILKCREGLEGAYVTINGGDIRVVSSDDGINATGENSSGTPGMMPGRGSSAARVFEEDIYLTVNGGNIYIETSGDGIDSNGSAVINGGNIRVYGPENNGNGSIDVGDGGYVLIMNSGTLLAAGSSGMAEYPYEGSSQSSLVFYLEESYPAGSVISVADGSGAEIISDASAKAFDFVCVSTADISQGSTYTLFVNEEKVASLEAGEVTALSQTERGNMTSMGRR